MGSWKKRACRDSYEIRRQCQIICEFFQHIKQLRTIRCMCLQETHRPTHLTRPKIAGMSLVAERPHNKYGSAILIRDDLKVDDVYE